MFDRFQIQGNIVTRRVNPSVEKKVPHPKINLKSYL